MDAQSALQPQMARAVVGRSALTVTHGTLDATPGEVLQVRDPEVRAVATQAGTDDASVSFTYLGPTEKSAPLASGEIRRQVGLKLRASDGCNLIYVMWRLEPKTELVVSVKENPGQHTHAECATRGYRNVKADAAFPLPTVTPGVPHLLAARVDGERLGVTVDGGPAITYSLGPNAAALHGPVGFRTDNARLDLTFSAAQYSGAATRSNDVPEDD